MTSGAAEKRALHLSRNVGGAGRGPVSSRPLVATQRLSAPHPRSPREVADRAFLPPPRPRRRSPTTAPRPAPALDEATAAKRRRCGPPALAGIGDVPNLPFHVPQAEGGDALAARRNRAEPLASTGSFFKAAYIPPRYEGERSYIGITFLVVARPRPAEPRLRQARAGSNDGRVTSHDFDGQLLNRLKRWPPRVAGNRAPPRRTECRNISSCRDSPPLTRRVPCCT